MQEVSVVIMQEKRVVIIQDVRVVKFIGSAGIGVKRCFIADVFCVKQSGLMEV
jgi:hypothetical protein